MKDVQQVLQFLQKRIEHIYKRPLMYGDTPEAVDLILHYYYEIWAEILDRGDEYRSLMHEAHAEVTGGSMSFAWYYCGQNPSASDPEVVAYVVAQWQRLGERLGLKISEN